MSDLVQRTGSREIANNPDPRYLLNTRNGRVVMWQPILAVEKHMVDCDVQGNVIDRELVAADDPYIQQETKRVADNLVAAGAKPDTVKEFGNMLTQRGIDKFKALEGQKKTIRITDASRHKSLDPDDPFYRVYARIDQMASDAIGEIQLMTLQALRQQAGHDEPGRVKPSVEVSYQWQIDQVLQEIRA